MPGGCLFLLPKSRPLNLASVLLRSPAGTSSLYCSACRCAALELPALSEQKEGTMPETFCGSLESDENLPCMQNRYLRGTHPCKLDCSGGCCCASTQC